MASVSLSARTETRALETGYQRLKGLFDIPRVHHLQRTSSSLSFGTDIFRGSCQVGYCYCLSLLLGSGAAACLARSGSCQFHNNGHLLREWHIGYTQNPEVCPEVTPIEGKNPPTFLPHHMHEIPKAS